MSASLPEFLPSGPFRNPHFQSILASIPLRKPFVAHRARRLIDASRVEIITTGDGVRLKCLRARPAAAAPVAVLIHGWEGSANSLYMLSACSELYNAGFDVWRLQLRDHGNTHELNEGIFHSCRIDEMVDAVGEIQRLVDGRPLCLGGFSLGANFSMRIAARADAAGLALAQVVALCPVLHPPATLDALENGPASYNYYFMRKWRRSLRRKHRFWPHLYDLEILDQQRTMRALTEFLVTQCSNFPDLMTYLNGYSLLGDALAPLTAPTLLVAAEDDPIIPITELAQLARPANLEILTTELGGHCGYLYSSFGPTWADDVLIRKFCAATGYRPARRDAA
ncbi:MAG: alpha/beta fold hydrolase [Gammaproteobacteria bacterium]|nr:alpha/beta fold hydrolase [Gammaproteobacteria bacterium]NNF61063.1 alpha/beta fold hydrolase [Gammaproteobacteria bacterium]NNM21424.1 alpha/beta fold hydrolase [Gammaproteobacteria bacterium]